MSASFTILMLSGTASHASEPEAAAGIVLETDSQDASVTVEGTVDSGEYTTIQVNAEDDSGGMLLYAIDSDAPEAFQSSNEFTVLRGSEHTVYVKDPSGKISAQVYKVPVAEVDMEVNIGYSDTSSSSLLTDAEKEAVEKGGGTVAEKVITDDSNTSERLFYTVTTKDEHVFYVMIDQSRSDNNVYLLDQVTDEDLYALTGGEGKAAYPVKQEEPVDLTELMKTEQEDTPEKKGSPGDFLLYGVLILSAAGAVYYYKVYKPKQANKLEMDDARDLDEFEAEEENEDDVLTFAISREEKENILKEIVNKDDFAENEDLSYDPYEEEKDSGSENEFLGEEEFEEEEKNYAFEE
jgi:hypothetical protein